MNAKILLPENKFHQIWIKSSDFNGVNGPLSTKMAMSCQDLTTFMTSTISELMRNLVLESLIWAFKLLDQDTTDSPITIRAATLSKNTLMEISFLLKSKSKLTMVLSMLISTGEMLTEL